MVFCSTIFIFVFLPLTFLFYNLCKTQYKNIILLVASLIFYACGEPRLVFLMIGSIICNYFFALAIERYTKKKMFLVLGILFNLGILYIFKYLGFSISVFNLLFQQNVTVLQFVLPIGISFYTFQSLSYIIDVYKKKSEAQKNILNMGLYISLFPQLIAGPIVRYNSIAKQIQERTISPALFGNGAKRFMCGFCKKVILANNLSNVAAHYFTFPAQENTVVGAWLGSICFSLQIFYDFSGYSDMAIGLGRMLGFEFEENFNYPYISRSITEFWRRWHISLSKWFRDYIYIPLGGSRVSVPRHIPNMAIVWILTGIWHGANYSFLAWGFLYFVALVVEKYLIKSEKRKNVFIVTVYRILILLFINFEWVIFNADGLKAGMKYCLSMIGIYYGNTLINAFEIRMLREFGAFILSGILFSTPIAPYIASKLTGRLSFIEKYLIPFLYILGFMWAVSYLILGSHNPFIYCNF